MHLGSTSSNYKDFWEFLECVAKLPVTGRVFKCNSTEITIKKPGTIVLLGDILELWDPLEDDRNYVIREVLVPLSILNALDCDIIYVIGNHDEDLLEFKRVWREKEVEYPCKGKGTFKIVFRSYPERIRRTKRVEGIEIGKHRYAFLHGHQFDKLQIFYTISRYLNFRFDPIDWFQDLTNVSFTKNIGLGVKKKDTPKGFRGKIKTHMATVIFSVLLIMYISLYYLLKAIPIGSGLGILWVIISAFFVVTILPKVVTFLNTEIWRRRRILGIAVKKGTSVKDVVKGYYKPKKGRHIKADTIVFGHTHNAGWYMKEPKEPEEMKRMFINTGCWVSDCEEEGGIPNTFLYIDTDASYLLKWDKGEIKPVERGEGAPPRFLHECYQN